MPTHPDYGISLTDPRRQNSIDFIKDSQIEWIRDTGIGGEFALLLVEPFSGLWAVRSRFDAGSVVQPHLHSGYVTATTIAGTWRYPEMKGWCGPGDYLTELAGTVHSLQVADTGPADILFTILGSIIYFNENGTVDRIEDWRSVLDFYEKECNRKSGRPHVMGIGNFPGTNSSQP